MSKFLRITGYILLALSTLGIVVLRFSIHSQNSLATQLQQVEEAQSVYPQENDVAYIYELIRLQNIERNKRGLPSLEVSYQLQKSALLKAYDMFYYGYWDHFNPKEPQHTPWYFIKDVFGQYLYAGENLGRGFYTPQQLMQAWMNSKTHRENILNPDFRYIGISRIRGEPGTQFSDIVVVHFATDLSGASAYNVTNPAPDTWIFLPNYNDIINNTLLVSGITNSHTSINLDKTQILTASKGIFAKEVSVKDPKKESKLIAENKKEQIIIPLQINKELKPNLANNTPMLVINKNMIKYANSPNVTASTNPTAIIFNNQPQVMGVLDSNTNIVTNQNIKTKVNNLLVKLAFNSLKLAIVSLFIWIVPISMHILHMVSKTKYHPKTDHFVESALGALYSILLILANLNGTGII